MLNQFRFPTPLAPSAALLQDILSGGTEEARPWEDAEMEVGVTYQDLGILEVVLTCNQDIPRKARVTGVYLRSIELSEDRWMAYHAGRLGGRYTDHVFFCPDEVADGIAYEIQAPPGDKNNE
jgi:hypothetical protein